MDTDDWSYSEQQLFHSHFPLIETPSLEPPGSFDAFFFVRKVGLNDAGLNDAMLSCSCSEKKKRAWVGRGGEFNLDKGRRESYTYLRVCRGWRSGELLFLPLPLSPHLPTLHSSLIRPLLNKSGFQPCLKGA